ncbi:DUF2723 domain-containing protein [Planctomycetota bacterium]
MARKRKAQKRRAKMARKKKEPNKQTKAVSSSTHENPNDSNLESKQWPNWYLPWDFRSEWKIALALSVFVSLIYLATASRTVTLADSGMFISSCYYWGVSHPPGYPLHSMLGKLFTMLPIGSIAFRVVLLSIVFGTATCVCLFAIARSIRLSIAAAVATAIVYSLSKTFWSQAIIAEVYTLHTFFIFLLLWGSLHFRATGSRRVLYWLAAGLGLSMANHWPFTLLSAAALMWILLTRWRLILRTLPVTIMLFIFALVIPYGILIWRSQMAPPINFYGPLETWAQIKYLILREGIRGVGVWVPRTPDDRTNFLLFFNQQFLIQITYLGAVFAAIGWFRQWWMVGTWNALALFAIVFFNSCFLVLWINPDYTYFRRIMWVAYPIIAYGVVALWFGMGLDGCLLRLYRRWPNHKKWIAGVIPGVLCILVFCQNVHSNNRKNDQWAYRYAKAVLDTIEPNGIYFTHGELDTGPLAYLNLVEGYHSEVTLYNSQGIVFDKRLFRQPVNFEESSRILTEFVDTEQRPIYYLVDIPHSFGFVDYGLFKQVNKLMQSPNSRLAKNQELIDYFLWVSRQNVFPETWEFAHRLHILGNAAFILHGMNQQITALTDDPKVVEILECADQFYLGRMGKLRAYWGQTDPQTLMQWMLEIETMDPLILSDAEKSDFYVKKASLHQQLDEVDEAKTALRESIRLFPVSSNPAVVKLLTMYAMTDQKHRYRALRERMFDHNIVPPEIRELDTKISYVER